MQTQTYKVTQYNGFTFRTIFLSAPSIESARATAWAMSLEVVSVELV